MRTTARFECVAGLQPKQKARETTTRETLYSSLSFRLIIYDVPILFGSPFHHLLRQIVGIEILSVRTVVYEYSCIRPSCKSIVTNLSAFFSYVRTYVLEKFRNRFPSRRDARINILETGRDLIWKFISWASSFIDGPPPPSLFVSKFLLRRSYALAIQMAKQRRRATLLLNCSILHPWKKKKKNGGSAERSEKDIENNLRHSTSVKGMEIFAGEKNTLLRDFLSSCFARSSKMSPSVFPPLSLDEKDSLVNQEMSKKLNVCRGTHIHIRFS